ncbi:MULTISPECIES: hypothetical protein [Microbacterium]|uniref:hypothetical protein n=1 Tax=Microbacterium TaxID=33882 RepID=UPI000B86B79C|nr:MULTISPECIES: hypothetical protein [Microbacterium]NJI57823.1 hypothetical protein [Microbacterium sp. B19(2022)]
MTHDDRVRKSIALLWLLAGIVASGTLAASVAVTIATVNMPGHSPSLKDAANVTALVFCLVSLCGGAIATLSARSSRTKRRVTSWATFGTALVGALVTAALLILATT